MRKAFTLVEMLVALVLISLLIGVAVFAFRLQLITIHKAKTEGLNTVIKYTQVRSLIESMKYYVVQEYNMLNLPTKQLHYFFQGDSKHIKFITTNPLYSTSDSLVELSCKGDKLVYKEEPLYGKIDFLQPDFLDSSDSSIMYKNLSECTFFYQDQDNLQKNDLQNKMPKAVGLKMTQNHKQQSMYISVKSNDDSVLGRVYNAIYPPE